MEFSHFDCNFGNDVIIPKNETHICKRRSPLKKPFASFFSAFLFLCGCASVSLQRGPSAALRLSPQWRQPTGSNARTIEVFVENGANRPLELSDIALSAGHAPAPKPL